MLLPPHYLDGVVAIGTDAPDRTKTWVASGVHYAEAVDDLVYPFLVTNKHVIDGLESAYVRINPKADGPALELEVTLRGEGDETYWYPHPDPGVDIAVTPIDLDYIHDQGLDTYFFVDTSDAMTVEQLRDHQVSEGDGVYVLGFPMGIVGGERSSVIARGGWIARIRDTLGGANKTFLVDAAVFPGNSGGAVVLRPDAASFSGGEPVRDSALIGIVASYVPYRDTAISVQTQRPRVIFEENSGLVTVYPIDYINDVIASIPELPDGEDTARSAPVETVPASQVTPTLNPGEVQKLGNV